MLIPNKFNGYQADGRRLLPVGGGVGEAALLGAALGGGSAALTGGDPLKGALLGGLTGGIGGGLGGAAAGGAGAAGTAAGAGAGTAAGTTAGSLLPAGQTFAQASQAANAAQAAAQTAAMAQAPTAALNASINSALPLTSGMGSVPGIGGVSPFIATAPGAAAPQGIASLMNAAPAATAAPASTAAAAGAAPMTSFQQAMQNPLQYIKDNPFKMGAAALAGAAGAQEEMDAPTNTYDGPLKRFRYSPDVYRPRFAEGGITNLPVERMSERNDAMSMMSNGGRMYAAGGISSLGSYSDGGRMLKGPGDGMSDSIPASIANKRPARLADGEFVVPADVVSHLGNGSTDAGARQLYAMMDKVRKARTGNKKQGRQIQPQKMMPA